MRCRTYTLLTCGFAAKAQNPRSESAGQGLIESVRGGFEPSYLAFRSRRVLMQLTIVLPVAVVQGGVLMRWR
jgi:hypothetical protein